MLYKAIITKHVKGVQRYEVTVEADDKMQAALLIDSQDTKTMLRTAENYEVTGINIESFGEYSNPNI